MKKFRLLLLLVVIVAFGCQNDVYICNGPSSHRYHHSKRCIGLSNCSTDIEKISLQEAKDKGRSLCGYED